jgi:6-phosphogluconolactonase
MTDSAGRLQKFDTADAMFHALADEIVAQLKRGVAERGTASFVCSGGTTPGALYDILAGRDAPWNKVVVTLSDERWIAPSEDGSNEKLVRTRLLVGKAAVAHMVPMKTDDASPDAAEGKVGAAIAAVPVPFDVTLLGMGDDGHTASLYPHSQGLENSLDIRDPALVRGVHTDHAVKTGERMTLTLRALLDSQWIVILLKGEEKLRTYNEAVAGTDVQEMPVRALLNQNKVPVQTFWAP